MIGDCIYTRRLQLRRIREQDLPLILAWSNSEAACSPYLSPERHIARTLGEQFARSGFWTLHDKTFMIEKRGAGIPIGTIHYWLRQEQRDTATISLKIAETGERCNGYGTEAQKFIIIHLFDQVGLTAVQMYTDINNRPQQRCLEKLGFSIETSLAYDDRQVMRTGYLFRLTRKDYRLKPIYRFHYE